MSASFAVTQAAIRPEAFWLAVDDRLAEMGQPNALWTEELSHLYRAGVSVGVAVRCVLVGRGVRA